MPKKITGFNIEDILVESFSRGTFGEFQLLRLTHKPTGLFVEKEFDPVLGGEKTKSFLLKDLEKLVSPCQKK